MFWRLKSLQWNNFLLGLSFWALFIVFVSWTERTVLEKLMFRLLGEKMGSFPLSWTPVL